MATLAEPRLRAILHAAGWPETELDQALRVAYRESRWRPRAVNRYDPSGGSFGLFQINGWWTTYGASDVGESLDRELALRPLYNARYAYRMWLKYGWKPWDPNGGYSS